MASTSKVKTLDRWFSKYIRLRDTNGQGYGNCCSCGKLVFWKEAHAGHYINRSHWGTRWSEENVHLQCVRCNCFDESNASGYINFLMTKYGKNINDKLLFRKNVKKKYCDFELTELSKYYRGLVKKILKERGL